jgi:colanic acid/amylovoran biosynthesis glycosyltransferase
LNRPPIAYVMSRFPYVSETFILREMTTLAEMGWPIRVYPLVLEKPKVIHPEAQPWMASGVVKSAPFVSRAVLAANLRRFTHTPGRYTALWCKVLWENRSSPNFLARAVALFPKAVWAAERMERAGVAHIHAHYATHPALFAWIIHRLTGISYSITVHAHDIYVRRAMLGVKLQEAEFIAAISEFNRRYLMDLYGEWVGEKTQVIHCGIRPQDYTPALPPRPDGRFEILNIGSLQPYKGQRYLIEACALLKARGVSFRCRIIGGGKDQPRLEQQIASAGLESWVELVGPKTQEEVARLLSETHCYVQPSIITPSGKMEGIPVAIMEALASMLPVVATRMSGVPELVRSEETGVLVPPADAQALAGALEWVYRHPQEAAQLGQRGREWVLQKFSLLPNVHLLSDQFDRVLGAGKIAPVDQPLYKKSGGAFIGPDSENVYHCSQSNAHRLRAGCAVS